jgi:hypothetical protein
MNLKPWREIAVPHEDVLKGTFQQAEFAADISRVHEGSATEEYQNAALFFQRTFITEGMRLLLDSVVKRLAGKGGDPVIQLQTAFGGGKTHTMLAVYHLAKGETPASDLQGISTILNAADIVELPRARMAVLDGINSSPNQPKWRDSSTGERVAVNTLWGDLAWQLGGEDGYALVQEADRSGTSPGKDVLVTLLSKNAPCVILMDELVAYIRQFEEGKPLKGGTFDSNLTFIQALTEALKAVPTAILLASLPESDKEAGSQRGAKALESLSHYFGRVQALWKPVSSEEAFEIVRRRLFSSINDKLAMETVCREFADFYIANASDFPQETQQAKYYQRLIQAYPIHPEVFDRLYEDWSSLDNFQRTRGVLKLMAKVIHRLWKDNDKDPLIMPGSFPLQDADARNEMIYHLPQGWDPVLEKDIDGERAETTDIENKDPRMGSVQACRRSARTIFLGSAPSAATQLVRGIELERILLGVALPGQSTAIFKDALRKLGDKLHYLNSGNNRFWFDIRPNLRREMEERKRRFDDRDDVLPAIRERVKGSIGNGPFTGVHVFTPGIDVPDDWALRLVVLPPIAAYSKSGQSSAQEHALQILKNRGEQPRQKQNRLIFLAADFDSVSRLKDQVRSMLAWQSIVSDYKDNRITLDNLMGKHASTSLEEAKASLQRMVREAYKWVLAPVQHVTGKAPSELEWEAFPVSATATNLVQEIERTLKDNELLITEWAPIHLNKLLKQWFWKDGTPEMGALEFWQKSCQYLYLPRLKDDNVYRSTLAAGMASKDFFGSAQGKDGDKYLGFVYDRATTPMLDDSLLLIEPAVAAAYADKLFTEQEAARIARENAIGGNDIGTKVTPPGVDPVLPGPGSVDLPPAVTTKTSFYATVDIDPVKAKMDFATVVEEVIQQFSSKAGVKVRISVEIQANSNDGFDDGLQRSVKENCRVLKFNSSEFE